MLRKAAPGSPACNRYWQRRVRSKAFREALTALVMEELRALSGERLKDVLDVGLVRKLIQEWDARMMDRETLATLIIQGNRRMTDRLKRRDSSLLGLLDQQLVADIDAILKEDVELPTHVEEFIANMMRQEFVRRLFTDIIFTSIVSFYQRVNPLFGAIAMRILEDQIKSFIRLFMPMIQKQATAFAVNKQNQRVVLDFGRVVIRQLLDEPLPNYSAMISPRQRRKAEALIRKALGNAKLDALIHAVMLSAWDDAYRTIRNKKVGDLIRLEEHAGWLAERCSEVILPALSRPQVLRFVANEMALAATVRNRVSSEGAQAARARRQRAS
jgi:hypothetical protein